MKGAEENETKYKRVRIEWMNEWMTDWIAKLKFINYSFFVSFEMKQNLNKKKWIIDWLTSSSSWSRNGRQIEFKFE